MARTTAISRSNRNAGIYTSTPQAIPAGVDAVRLYATLAGGEKASPGKSLWFHIEGSPDGGITWRHVIGGQYVTGPWVDEQGNVNPDPYVEIGVEGLTHIRAQAILSNRINVGLDVETLP